MYLLDEETELETPLEISKDYFEQAISIFFYLFIKSSLETQFYRAFCYFN